jgi:N-acetylglutamate synthase-like GNAT family acetyltransferase
MSQLIIQSFALDKLPLETHQRLCKLDSEWIHIHKAHQVEKGFIQVLVTPKNLIGYVVVKHNNQSSAHIHKIYIHQKCRRRNYGSQLLLEAMKVAAQQDYDELYVECEKEFIPFFSTQGYVTVREPHRDNLYNMEMPCLRHYIKVRSEDPHLESDGRKALFISQDSHHYKYNNQTQFIDFHRSMLAQAQRQISILSDTIVHPLFKEDYVRQCLLNLSKRNAQARIRILLLDDRTGAGYHNPLIDLAQKLTSFIELRVLARGASKPNEMITTVDFSAGIYRKDLDSYNGFVNYGNQMIAQRLRDSFDQYWERSTPSANMRRLSI